MTRTRVAPLTRWSLVSLAALAIAAAPRSAAAQSSCSSVPLSSPYLWLIVNDVCTDLSSQVFGVSGIMWGVDTQVESGGSTFTIKAIYDKDPFITFGATTTNLIAGPTTFAFLFGTPIVPGLYNVATSTGGVSVTNGLSGTATVATGAVYPSFISGYGTVGLTPTNLAVDLGTSPCVASGLPFQVTTTCNYGTTSNTFSPTFYDNLEALLTYTQTDIASVASWSGAVTLNLVDEVPPTTTPEPASIVLMATGLVSAAGAASRRRSRVAKES